MYYITPITENPYVKKQINTMLKNTSPSGKLPTEQHKNSTKHKICTNIEIFLFILFFLDIFVGFHFVLHNINLNIYHFANENIIPIIYLVSLLALSVYKEYPNLPTIQVNFYSRFYIFFLIYTAFCNILTSYQIYGIILFMIVGFGLAVLYLAYFIYTSCKALDSFIEATANPSSIQSRNFK